MTRLTLCLLVGILAAVSLSRSADVEQFEGVVKLTAETVFAEHVIVGKDTIAISAEARAMAQTASQQLYMEFRFRPELFRVISNLDMIESDDIYQLSNNRRLHYSYDSTAYLVDAFDAWDGRVEDIQVLDDTLTVLGRSCRGIQVTMFRGKDSKPEILRFYADTTLYIDPAQFENVKYEGWGAIIGALRGMPLLMECVLPGVSGLELRFKAVEIRHAQENERLFWPKNGARIIDNFKH